MITFMQRVLQRHYQWLFILLLIVVIISFVFTIGAAPGISSGRSNKKRDFYGFNLNDESDTQELFHGSALSVYLTTGSFPESKHSMEETLLARAVLLHVADTLQIPEPTEEELIAFIQSRPAFQGITGNFDQGRYEEFVAMAESGFKSENARVFMAQDMRIEKAVSALRDPGYITPFEVQQQAELMGTQWSLLVASLDYESFSPEMNIAEEDLRSFYEENAHSYTLSERAVATYINFDADPFETEIAAPTEDELMSFWSSNPNLFTAESFEDSRDTIAAAFVREQAKRKASERAMEFAYALYNQNIAYGTDAFTVLLKKHGLALKSLPPFTEEDLNTLGMQQSLPYNLLAQAFALNDTHYYSEPIPTVDGSAILFYEGMLPTTIPAFSSVRERVENDYKLIQKRRLFAEKAIQLEDELRAALSSGKSFEQATGKAGLSTQAYEPFSIRTAPNELDSAFLAEIKHFDSGEMTSMVPTPQGGSFIFVEDKKIPEIEEGSAEWEEAQNQLSFITAHANIQNFVAEMINAGMQKIN
tara:strand:- start:3715 stop:5310 length:1596 start_codon:yes stop_codon:yes gene_type:complete